MGEPPIWYHGRCISHECRFHCKSLDYHERGRIVGEHRIATGHTVHMYVGDYGD